MRSASEKKNQSRQRTAAYGIHDILEEFWGDTKDASGEMGTNTAVLHQANSGLHAIVY